MLTLIVSCSEEFSPQNEDTVKQAVILSEFEVGTDVIEMTLTTTFSLNEGPSHPGEALQNGNEPFLSNLDNGATNKTFRYQNVAQKWINDAFQYQPGHTISLTANLAVVGLENIYAETTIPIAGEINIPVPVATDNIDTYDFQMELSVPELEDNFYHIIPYVAASADDPSKQYLNIDAFAEGEASVFGLSHIDGILIDVNRAGNFNTFNLSIRKSELPSNPSKIYLKVKTVAKEYYDFHRSLTLQAESDQGPFDAPFPTVSNIERGQGIFTAYTVSLDSIIVE
jgi:hypothetical protein